ncbi:MAG: T3SS effector HopA1 family protein [Cyanobacteria bacterium P01_F01_bin.3]
MFILAADNAVEYLANQQLISSLSDDLFSSQEWRIEPRSSKNFSLFVHLSEQHKFLLKQERLDAKHQFRGDLRHEWKVFELVNKFPALQVLKNLISQAIHFNHDCAVLTLRYLSDYQDLREFYERTRCFSPVIASTLGVTLARLHTTTLDRDSYHSFLIDTLETDSNEESESTQSKTIEQNSVPEFGIDLQDLTPELFQHVSTDGLKFYRLYQQNDALQKAIAQISDIYEPCCLIHDDLKFDNILLHRRWQDFLSISPPKTVQQHTTQGQNIPQKKSQSIDGQAAETPLRIIDWECWSWGDPAHDVGALVAQYLKLWLKSLIVNKEIDIHTALKGAGTPLEVVQPSLVTFISAYMDSAPSLLEIFPDFLTRVMKFAGLALIDSIQTLLHYYEAFSNTEICMLQVAQQLLCNSELAVQTVFGLKATALQNPSIRQAKVQAHACHWVQSAPEMEEPEIGKSDLLSEPYCALEFAAAQAAIHTHPLTLQTLAEHLHIQPDFTLTHLGYPPAEPLNLLNERADKIAPSLQPMLRQGHLRNYLYDIYFSGESSTACLPITSQQVTPDFRREQPLKNNGQRGIDVDIYEALSARNSGIGYFDPDWQVVKLLETGELLVSKEGLTVRINPAVHLRSGRHPYINESVDIRLPNHRIESGFYVAIGDAGFVADDAATVEICLNLSPEAAVHWLGELTRQFNAISIPFCLKVLIDADRKMRCDSVVLQIEQYCYPKIHRALGELYAEELYKSTSALRPNIPLFMKAIAPGIGLAEEPDLSPHDFGLHRTQLLAGALIVAWQSGENTPEQRMQHIEKTFTQQGLDLERPYLNPGSKDIYTPLT